MGLSRVLGGAGVVAIAVATFAGGADARSSWVGGYGSDTRGGPSVTVPVITLPATTPGAPVTVPSAGSTIVPAPAAPVEVTIIVSNVQIENGSVITADVEYVGLPAGATVQAVALIDGNKGLGFTCAGAAPDEHLADLAHDQEQDDPNHIRLYVDTWAGTVGPDWIQFAVAVNVSILDADGTVIGNASSATPCDDPSLVITL